MKAMILVFLSSSAMAATCPLGGTESSLTLQRVMMNFGKYTETADAYARAGAGGTDSAAAQAVRDLEIVEACADAVIAGASPALLPSGAAKLTGDERAKYVDAFKQAMGSFKVAVMNYAQAITDSCKMQPRDTSDVLAKKKIVDDIADDAHSHF